MSNSQERELVAFHNFVGQKLVAGDAMPSPEEALDQWRCEHPSPQLGAEDAAAIREALDDMAAGDSGRPFAEFDREFRIKHGLAPRP